MKTSLLTIAVCFLFSAPAPCWAQTRPSDTTLAANPIFQKNCAKCHGKSAGGRHFGGPSLISDKATSTDDLHNIIANGKGRMPKYGGKLTSEEIDILVQEINRLNKK